MDNDRKVTPKALDDASSTDLVEQTKAYFLQAAMDEFKSAQDRYNLNDEFAKTRKNRNLIVLGSVAVTILVFVLFAFFFNGYLDAKNNQVSISTQEFDDINLRDLLDKAKKLESELSLQKAKLQIILDDQASAITKARSDSADLLAMYRSKNPKADELEARTDELQRALDTKILSIATASEAKQKSVKEAIAGLEAQLAAFDSRKLSVAQQQEVVLNNERKVYDVERQRIQDLLETQIKQITTDYDAQLKKRDAFIQKLEASSHDTLVNEQERLKLLYNPLLADDLSRYLLTPLIDTKRLGQFSLAIPETYHKAGILSPKKVDAVNQTLADYKSLIGILNQVPYTNSIPSVIDQLRYRAILAVDATAALFDDFWKTIKEREAVIAEREATIKEREQTIGERDRTILEREATIAEREAALKDRDEQISAIKKDAKGLSDQIDQEQAAYDNLLGSYETYAAANAVDGIVVDAKDSASASVYFRPSANVVAGERFYLLHGANEVAEEYELSAAGKLARISPVPAAARTKLVAKAGAPAPAKITFSGKPALVMDWLVRVESYTAWKAAAAKAATR